MTEVSPRASKTKNKERYRAKNVRAGIISRTEISVILLYLGTGRS